MATMDSTNTGSAVASYLAIHGCDCSSNLASLVGAFQSTYNADVGNKVYNGPQLLVDGKYGSDVATALSEVFGGINIPKPCYGAGNPCFGKGIIPSGATITPPLPNLPAPVPTEKSITEYGPLLYLIGAIAVGVASVIYYKTEKEKANRSTRDTLVSPKMHRI